MSLRVGLVGFGTVGQSVARALASDHRQRIRLARVCARPGGRSRPSWLSRLCRLDEQIRQAARGRHRRRRRAGRRGLARARRGSRGAARGRQVGRHGQQAARRGVRPRVCRRSPRTTAAQLRFEGAVAGGVPIIRAVQDGLAGDRLVRIGGVLNGTCNYILTRMECAGRPVRRRAGRGAGAGLRRGRSHRRRRRPRRARQARHPLRGRARRPRAVHATSPAPRSPTSPPATSRGARRSGCAIRQVSWAERVDGDPAGVRASVGPALVPLDSPVGRAPGLRQRHRRAPASSAATRSSPDRAPAATRPPSPSCRTCSPSPRTGRPGPRLPGVELPSSFPVRPTTPKGPYHHA